MNPNFLDFEQPIAELAAKIDGLKSLGGANNLNLTQTGYAPHKWSLMTDYAPSEFSLFRLQLARDNSMQGNPDDSRISLQYIYSLGPHGAHKF